MEHCKFIKELGRGGFGHVWLVKGTVSNKQVFFVLKQINLQHSTKGEQKAAYQEAKLLSTLKHPNIVSYFDSFYNSDGSLFIVMDFCQRGDMYNYIKKRKDKPFEEKQIVYWFVQLCMALKYLHGKNILHRDLKTKNIYLSRSKLIKIGDFGISRVLNNRNDMAMTIIGTPSYMSPEIFCSRPYNYKSDIWGLGCCLYEMITLKQAFIAEDYQSLILKVTTGMVFAFPGTWNKELIDIVLSMLSQNPAERPSAASILLTSFMRKYTLLFLDEASNILTYLGAKEEADMKFDTTPFRRKNIKSNSSGEQQLEYNSSRKNSKVSCDISPNNKSQTRVVTVPDINGNGDGNDNSQHRTMSIQSGTVTPSTCRSAASSSTVCIKENINPTKTANFFKHTKPVQKIPGSVSLAQENSLGAHNVHSKVEKHRGERSIEFLINLTYSLKLARSSSGVSSNAGGVPALPNVKQDFLSHNRDCRKSHSSFGSSSYSNTRSKLFSPSVKSDSAILSEGKRNQRKVNGICSNNSGESDVLPRHVVLPEVSKILFPVCGSSADSELSEKATCDKNIDNSLLREILACEKTTTTSRQRRREKLKANSLTKSAPASVESLPVIVSREV